MRVVVTIEVIQSNIIRKLKTGILVKAERVCLCILFRPCFYKDFVIVQDMKEILQPLG